MTVVSLYQVGKVLGTTQVSGMAPQVGLNWPPPPPISVKNLVNSPRSLQTRTFTQGWTTPSGTPLGGWVTLVINSDGTYTVEFRTDSTGLESFDFWLRAYLQAPGIGILFFYHEGHVSADGTDDTHPEAGSNPLIAMYWNEIAGLPADAFYVHHDYKGAGVFGALEDLVDDLLDITAGAVGEALGAVIAVTQEAISWLHLNLGPGGTIGVIAGVVVFAVGALAGLPLGSAVILGIVSGAAVGAVSNALIQTRPLTPQEIAVAEQVFGSELDYQSIMLSNLCGIGGRAFTSPGVDGKIYCCLGSTYGDTLHTGPCPAGGQHDHTGSYHYLLEHDTPPAASQQTNWQWCNKCQWMTYAGSATTGPCPAGGSHDHTGSYHYLLEHDTPPAASQQTNWQWCNKCQGLAYAGLGTGICPATGGHNFTGSDAYLLQYDTPPTASQQANWQWCNKCQGLTYALPTRPGDYSYPIDGERLIHELTHAWQIQHNSFVPGFMCSGIVNQVNYIMGDDVYAYGSAGPPWSSFNLEQQAQIVNEWFGGDRQGSPWGAMNKEDPYYQYIAANILTGTTGYSTSWLASS